MPNIPYKDALNNTRYLKNSPTGTNLDPDVSPLESLVDALETQVGVIAETAPVSDTASSGLNGRLQRIAQRITSAIALVGNIDTRLGTSGAASSKAGSNAAQLRAIADILDGTIDKTSTVTFTIANGANLSDTIDIGAGRTLLALITPSAFTAADLVFNTHPTSAGSVCQKVNAAGTRYRLVGIPTTAAANFRLLNTDFIGDRYIQLASVTVWYLSAATIATAVAQGGSRTIVGLVGTSP